MTGPRISPPTCERCGATPPLVGMFSPPDVEWLCVTCLEEAFRQLGERIRRAVKARLN